MDDPRATALLALLYLKGQGVPADQQHGTALLRRAARLGDPRSRALLQKSKMTS